MIFILDEFGSVDVYESIDEVVNYIEWQDIFEGEQLILDDKGNIYEWDSSKTNEIGTVYDYTLILSSRKSKLIDKVIAAYLKLGNPESFKIDNTIESNS